MTDKPNSEESWMLEGAARIFEFLRKVSIIGIFQKLTGKNQLTHAFIDKWVLGHTIAAFLSQPLIWYILNYYENSHFRNAALILVVLYGFLRVFEIIVNQINIVLFDGYRAEKAGVEYAIKGYRRIVLLLLLNYLEIIMWFSASYTFFVHPSVALLKFETALHGSLTWIGALHSSFIVMTNFGSSPIKPEGSVGFFVIWFESVVGLFMTLISLARFISILPTPKSMSD